VTYEVSTPVFSGPLGLLLQLVTSHRVEITELRLTDVVDEFVAYLRLAAELDLEVTSEFLLMAATLIQLKARHLLPGDDGVDLDEELLLAEERDRLLSRLLACLTYKDVAAVIAHRLEGSARFVPRRAGMDPGVVGPALPPVELPVDAMGLARLAAGVIGRRREPDLDHLDLDLPSVSLAIEDVRRRVAQDLETDFDALTSHLGRPVEVVAYFLAVLELSRWGLVEATQEDLDAAIRLRHRRDAELGEISSEWDR
jgi:segregation and condensation protein A